MEKINHKNHGENTGVVPRFSPLISLFTVLCLMAAPAPARAGTPVIGDYTAYPPFLPEAVSPNILFLLDYSKSMVRPSYGTCYKYGSNPTTPASYANCGSVLSGDRVFNHMTDDYSSTTAYYGYFDNGYGRTDIAGCSVESTYTDACAFKYNCSANSTCSKETGVDPGEWNGNWLNWLTMTQFDVMKKVVIGGDTDPAPDNQMASTPNLKSKLTSLDDTGTSLLIGGIYKAVTNTKCSGRAPDCSTNTPQTLPYSWIDSTDSGVTGIASISFSSSDDAVSTAQNLPFSFTFYGNTYSQVYISTNGYIGFTSSNMTVFNNLDMPDATAGYPDNIIAPFWDNLYIDATASVKTFTAGTAPNRIYVVSYENVRHSDDGGKADPLTFQILLFEGSSHIVFQYKKVTKTSASEPFFARGRSATVGVENSNGTSAKKYLYCDASSTDPDGLLNNCGSSASGLLSDDRALFMTPQSVLYQVKPVAASPTIFQLAAPLAVDIGLGRNDYNVNIQVTSKAKPAEGCVNGWYSNNTANNKTRCYDHEIVGLFQDLADGELAGTLAFRLGVMRVGYNGNDGGDIKAKGKEINVVAPAAFFTATRGDGPTDGTPLAEGMYEAMRFFKQDMPYWPPTGTADYNFDDATDLATCATTGNEYDPYCFQSIGKKVDCCKSFVLLLSSGNYSSDFMKNIYDTTNDATDAVPPVDAWSAITGETVGQEWTKGNGGWLDNVAYKAHVTDLRSDLGATQNLTLYVVNTFGEASGDGTNFLKRAAKYGGFEDTDSDSAYDSDKYNLVSGQCTGVASGGAYGEDDGNCDGVPNTYFEASGGSNLKQTIINAVLDILKRSASGTSVSVLATSQEGEGSLYQAYFYPAKVMEGTYESRRWVGYLRGFFLDSKGNIREDSVADGDLNLDNDYILRMSLDEASSEVKVRRWDTNANGDPSSETEVTTQVNGRYPLLVDDVSPIWEAGKRLALTGASTRTIYYTLDGSTLPAFTDAAAATLQPYLRAADPDGAGALTAVDEAGYIINWIRGVDRTGYRVRCVNMTETLAPGMADGCTTAGWRPWKLGDIVHSTPTVVAAPAEKYDKIYNDATYLTFKNAYKDRRNVVLVGANDGMLHAFNAGVFDKNNVAFTANPASGSGAGWGVGGKTWALGDELWAFVPRDNLPHLAWLACAGTSSDPAVCGTSEYTHVYLMDLKPKVTDVRIFCDSSADAPTSPNCVPGQTGVSHPAGWGTIAIVGMRFGGGPMSASADWSIWYNDLFGSTDFQPSYYAFDVTNPEYPPKLLWRFTDGGMGFTTSFPAVVRLGDPNDLTKNRWYAVFGSGPQWWTGSDGSKYSEAYKAKSDRTASVYIVNLQGDSQDGTLANQFTGSCNGTADTCFETNSSFMGDPSGVDTDVDNKVDVVYIGETYGGAANCWKNSKLLRINLREKSKEETGWLTDDWKTSVFTVNPSYAGTDCKTPTAGQALTIPPSIAKGADKTLWVYYGTGRQWTSDDKADTAPQSFYGIKEGFTAYLTNPNPTPAPTFPSAISVGTDSCVINMTNAVVKTDKSVSGVTVSGCSGTSPTTVSSYSDLLTAMRDSDTKGWKVNFGTSPTAERVLNRAVILGGVVMFTTYTPTGNVCSFLGDAAIYSLYYETGTAYEFAVLTGATEGATSVGGVTTSATGGVTSGGEILVKQKLEKGMPTSVGVAIGEEVRGFIQQSTGTIGSVKAQPALNVRSGVRGWKEKLK